MRDPYSNCTKISNKIVDYLDKIRKDTINNSENVISYKDFHNSIFLMIYHIIL